MTSLVDFVEPLKREIAVPGEFDTVFPNTTDEDLLATLGDALGEAQLDGYFQTSMLDTGDFTVTPDLSAAGAALVIIYAGTRILRSRLRALTSNQRYKAGSVEYETSLPANMLREELALLAARKKDLVTLARTSGRAIYQLDGYLARSGVDWAALGAFYPYELERA